jgi:hypothetical protein
MQIIGSNFFTPVVFLCGGEVCEMGGFICGGFVLLIKE